jgi:hypothetical protein
MDLAPPATEPAHGAKDGSGTVLIAPVTDALTVEGVVPSGVAGVHNKVAPVASVDAGVVGTKEVVGPAAGSQVFGTSDAGDMEVRVPMLERNNKKMRKRNGWPKSKNLKRYLATNPQCVVDERGSGLCYANYSLSLGVPGLHCYKPI